MVCHSPGDVLHLSSTSGGGETQFYHFAVSPLALPFSLSSAPWIFTMILREMVQYVRHHGINSTIFSMTGSFAIVIQPSCPNIYSLSSTLHLGWLVNLKKSDLVPGQQFTYLGLDCDTVLALVCPSLRLVKRLEACVRLFLWRPCLLARAVLRLLGHMVSEADLHTRPLQFCLLSQWCLIAFRLRLESSWIRWF